MFLGLLFTLISADQPLAYGSLYQREVDRRVLPSLHLEVGYGIDLTDSFSDLHSVDLSAQLRVWKYLSSGLLFQKFFPSLSDSGQTLKNTEPLFSASIPQPLWSLFSESKVQIIVGEWNLFNAFPLEVDLLLGGGVGIINERRDTDENGRNLLTYLWSVEQRFKVFEHQGFYLRFSGHRSGTFVGSGASFNF